MLFGEGYAGLYGSGQDEEVTPRRHGKINEWLRQARLRLSLPRLAVLLVAVGVAFR